MPVVVIPAYMPDKTLLKIADQLWSLGYRIIVVDDGSGEKYKEIFDAINDIAIVIHHKENKGKGAAIKSALEYIRKEIWDCGEIGVMDCDGQHLVCDMKKVLEAARIHPEAIVLGVRDVGQKMPWKSRAGNRITRMFFRMCSGVAVSDTQTGLRAFNCGLVKKLLAVEGEKYEYEMNVLLFAAKENIPIEEVKIRTIYHDAENSCSHFDIIRDSMRIYKGMFKFILSSFSSFIVDYLVFTVLMLILPHENSLILMSNIAARFISAFYNYSMNCSFVFHTKRKLKTAAEYFALAVLILLFNNIILFILVEGIDMWVYAAKIMTECILFLISFIVQRRFIFSGKVKNDSPISC